MALTASIDSQCSELPETHPPKRHFVKTLAESSTITSMLSASKFISKPYDENQQVSNPENSIPVIDYSLLTSGDPHQRSKTVHDLGKACEDWSNFLLINHSVPESLAKAMIEVCLEFFDLPEEEKWKYHGKDPLAPIVCGTSAQGAGEKEKERTLIWRDYLKFTVSPDFHTPDKPHRLREIASEYRKKTREVAMELFRGISESLGLESNYLEKKMDVENGFKVLGVSYYPPCPQPEKAVGLPQHTDHGFFTLLLQNGIGGFQVQHNGDWVNVDPVSNSFVVNIADSMEILTNGKYKSSVHRALVTNKATRITLAVANGPPFDKVVGPAPEFVDTENHPPGFAAMTHREYMQLQFNGAKLGDKAPLDWIKI